MHELHILHLWLFKSAELVLAYIFRKRLASSQRHVSHAVRDLFNHVYLFSSTTHTGRGVMRGSAARYGRLLVNTTKVPLLASRRWKMPLSRTIWDRTRPLWQERSRDWSLSLTLMMGSDGADSQVQGQNHWWSHDTTHNKQNPLSDSSLTPNTEAAAVVPKLSVGVPKRSDHVKHLVG